MKSLLFRKPTPIQRYAIPMIQSGLDILATAQTGSGKTLAFLCPIISNLLNGEEVIRPFFLGKNAMISPLALLIAPTRELVIQIDEQTWKLINGTNLRSFAVFGGINFNDQAEKLNEGQIDILSATPGRLIDMCSRNKVSLNFVKYLILDEADNILDLGLEKQTRDIILKRDLPDKEKRVTVMFSATFPSKIKELAQQFLRTHIYLKVGEIGSTTKRIKQSIKWVQEEFKKSVLYKDLKLLPDQKGKVIIFVSKRLTADSVSRFLIGKGLLSESIHGKQDQWQREECILKYKNDQFQYLVATSVASRGLDFSHICAVFNFDFPITMQDYMHRIGRTGRIGHKGIAISYFNDTNRSLYSSLKCYLSENHLPMPYWLRNY